MAKSATFTTELLSFGNNTGFEIPPEVIDKLAAGKRPGVVVNLNGYEFPNTVAVMDGRFMIGVSAAHRKASGLAGGDTLKVKLTLQEGPRPVDMPQKQPRNPERSFGSSMGSRTHCSAITRTPSTAPRRRRPVHGGSTRPSGSSSTARSASAGHARIRWPAGSNTGSETSLPGRRRSK